MKEYMLQKILKEERAKAIDEFVEKIKAEACVIEEYPWTNDVVISIWEKTLDEIAEQLKGV